MLEVGVVEGCVGGEGCGELRVLEGYVGGEGCSGDEGCGGKCWK